MITSGYVSRIPIINFTKEEKDRLICLSKEAYELAANKKSIGYVMLQIDNIINMAAKISKETIISINSFKDNLVKNT